MTARQQAARHRRRGLGLVVGTPLALIAAGVLAYGTEFGPFGEGSRSQAAAAPAVSDDAMAQVAAMQPGWNLGNSLDAGPDETSWGQPRTTKAMLDKLRSQGFRSIRIPVTWSDHQQSTPGYAIDKAYMSRVKQVVDWALDDGLYVMLNIHHDSWKWASKMPTDHDTVLARYKATWTQIAGAFRNEPGRLTFESINEPTFKGTDASLEAKLLNELNTSFHDVVRQSGGDNTKRLLVLPTMGDTPDQALMDNLAGTIKSLRDPRLVASVHYYGYWPFSTNLAGSTRFDATARSDMAKVFKRAHDTFVAQGVPVVLGEYGVLGYDFGPDGVERGEMLKYFEAFGNAARTNGVTSFLWDNGAFFDRSKLRWKDAGLFRQMRSSWTTRSGTASSDLVFVPRSGAVPDRTLTLNPNGTTFKGLRAGSATLAEGRDYTLSGNRLTLKATTLTGLAGDRAYGVRATLQAEFSKGVPWQIKVISDSTPVLSNATGTTGSLRIPTQFRGDLLATMESEYAEGGNAGPLDWTPYQQFTKAFTPSYTGNGITLTHDFLDSLRDGARVNLTFHFWSGAKVTYHVTRSGGAVVGTTS
ncbi:cellulase family glycosylhydrolase [Streptomyces sp. NPDC001833]|uniref:cellulase family glycosylhydrolase n=1 Tax=Streptomyces sp. NPDC001833 TaxID=3154658 RepID=UPI003328DE89